MMWAMKMHLHVGVRFAPLATTPNAWRVLFRCLCEHNRAFNRVEITADPDCIQRQVRHPIRRFSSEAQVLKAFTIWSNL